jgi:predicted HTH transcriptional regulator
MLFNKGTSSFSGKGFLTALFSIKARRYKWHTERGDSTRGLIQENMSTTEGITIPELERVTGISRNNIRYHLEILLSDQKIVEESKGRFKLLCSRVESNPSGPDSAPEVSAMSIDTNLGV